MKGVTLEQNGVVRFPDAPSERAVKHLEELGVEYFDWNVSAEDSIGCPTRESILRNVKKDFLGMRCDASCIQP